MKTFLRVYLDPMQQKVVKDLCKANMDRALDCSEMANHSGDIDVAVEFYDEYLAMKYLLETIESGKDEVLHNVKRNS